MQQYMSTYKVTLETKGPLYIGSGKQLGKKEYIHNRQKKRNCCSQSDKNVSAVKEKKVLQENTKNFY